MVDAVVTVFLEKLLGALADQTSIVFEFKDQFELLQTELQLMQSFLKDADRLKRKHQTLRTILASLRDLTYDAQDILADCQLRSRSNNSPPQEQQQQQQHVVRRNSSIIPCSFCFSPSHSPSPGDFSPLQISFQYQTGKRLKEINSKITLIKLNISSYLGVSVSLFGNPNLANPAAAAQEHNDQIPRSSSPLYDHTQVVGLEGDTKKIKEWLFEANHYHGGLLAIGIVGMGGVGKTTTVQTVYNDKQVEGHFERRMWVSVSQKFTIEKIMRSMLKSLGDASAADDRYELLKKINQYLQGKTYLLVMDDVWSEDNAWWLDICEGLPKGNGSSVLITTRIEIVARKMGVTKERTHRPKFLSDENSWLLFRKVAFAATGGECRYPELESVGKEIVQKCKGLPLAIKAVGGIMLCKSPYLTEWRRITDNFREELAENDDSVKASLQLSYDELPSHLKSCFLCFSLFPEDCVMMKEQLVHWWIGEGFVPLRNRKIDTEVAEDCFSGLINRCLIEVVDKTYNGTIITCKMHDLVRDLVIRLAEEDTFSTSDGMDSRHVSLRSDTDWRFLQTDQKLRAILSTTKTCETNKVASAAAKKFCECRYLRVLDLSKSIFENHLSVLLDHVGSLQHLTYLNLSNTHPLVQVPHSVDKLSNLQILNVRYCQNLKTLPSCITTLRKLIVLDVSHCGSLEYLPRGLGTLLNLQALLGFRPARPNQSGGCRMAELKNLTQLRTLELRLTRGDEIGDDESNVLLNLQKLKKLTISCYDSHGSNLVCKLDKLLPPPQLHELCLSFFPGETSPFWLNPVSLPILGYLSISSGNLVKMNQRFWGNESQVWKLEGLMLESLFDFEEDWAMIQISMPLLKVMKVNWCPKLDTFPIDDVGFRGDIWKKDGYRRWEATRAEEPSLLEGNQSSLTSQEHS